MTDTWARAPDATNRKLRELYAAQGGVNRKLKSLWAGDGTGVARKIFSGTITWQIAKNYLEGLTGYMTIDINSVKPYIRFGGATDVNSNRMRLEAVFTFSDPIFINSIDSTNSLSYFSSAEITAYSEETLIKNISLSSSPPYGHEFNQTDAINAMITGIKVFFTYQYNPETGNSGEARISLTIHSSIGDFALNNSCTSEQ